MLLKGISVILLLCPWIVNFVGSLLKTKAALESTNKHVTQTYQGAFLWNVNFVISLLKT